MSAGRDAVDTGGELFVSFGRVKGTRVLCVGDVMLDRFLYGHVDRVSPEAPIPVLRVDREASMLGGAGNVARNLVALGAHPTFISVVGDDAAGHEVTRLVGALETAEPRLLVDRGRPTTIKTRYVAGGQQLLRADHETTAPVSAAVAADIVQLAADAIGDCRVVVLSDYAKGVLTADVVSAIVARAKAAGVPVVVDPKGVDFARYRGADLLTPNRRELAEATQMPAGDDAQIVDAARSLIRRCAVAGVLATRGGEGMTLVTAAGAVSHLPSVAREVFDVSGAGDTVLATLAAALGAGIEWATAAHLANIAAGIVVGKTGTAVATPAEIARVLRHPAEGMAEDTVVSAAEAMARVEGWRRQKLRVGFTNGCFDLLHPGHVSLLGQARAACDRLVVGLNSDESTRRLKGPARPVQNETARSAVLASLASVDLVVVFGEDTPMTLIEALRPDVLVKGADYTMEKVVGADFVRAYGGRVVLADLSPGHSTTATIEKMSR